MRLIKPSSTVIYLTRVAVFSRENVLLQSVFKLYWWGLYVYRHDSIELALSAC